MKNHQLPVAMNKLNWGKTTLFPITETGLSSGWVDVSAQKDSIYSEDYKRTNARLRGAVKCSKAGESVEIKWNGTILGFSDIHYGSGCKIQIRIDADPITFERTQKKKSKYARFFYLPEQTPGEHTVLLTITELPNGTEYYLGQILVIGAVIP